VTATPTESRDDADPLDMLADLVDASLATISEGPDGEPRVTLLETLRAYARDQLRAAGEADAACYAHAEHYRQVAERLQSLEESQHRAARGLAEIELDNFREALSWTLRQDISEPTGSGGWIGLHLCSALGWLWWIGGYLVEGRRWYEQAIERAGESISKELAACLGGLAGLLISQGESERARDFATRSLTMARTLGDEERVAFALGVLGTAQRQLGDVDAAHRTFQEALHLHRKLGNRGKLARALGHLAGVEAMLSHFDRAEALAQESLSILQGLGDIYEAAVQGQNLANLFVITGRVDEANQLAKGLVETVLRLRSPNLTMAFANTYMNILIALDEPVPAAHLFGAEEAMRERNAMPNPHQQEELQETRTLVRELISVEDWEYHRRLGRGETVEDLLAQLSAS
jgi:tetratricopeptide (TPR) repeat protein